MGNATDRLKILVGEAGLDKLNEAKVTVIGLGGVGGQVAEAIVRSFVGRVVLVDGDRVDASNVNRQILATQRNVGEEKALLAAARAKEINPTAEITPVVRFVKADNLDDLPIWDSDVVLDAIDDVEAKVALLAECVKRGVKAISSMGAANRTDPTAFKVADISETHTCPLAKKMRKMLASLGITKGIDVVFSTEKGESFGGALGSFSFVPPAAGLVLASAAIRYLLARE